MLREGAKGIGWNWGEGLVQNLLRVIGVDDVQQEHAPQD